MWTAPLAGGYCNRCIDVGPFSRKDRARRVDNGGVCSTSAHLRTTGEPMSGLIWWLIVGGIAGLLAGLVMKGGGYGLVADIILGILGSFLGGWLFGMLGLGVGA